MYTPNYDPSELNRYPVSVSMAYYQPSDPTMMAAAASQRGDHTSSTFSRTTDGTSSVSSQQQTQQGERGLHVTEASFYFYFRYWSSARSALGHALHELPCSLRLLSNHVPHDTSRVLCHPHGKGGGGRQAKERGKTTGVCFCFCFFVGVRCCVFCVGMSIYCLFCACSNCFVFVCLLVTVCFC